MTLEFRVLRGEALEATLAEVAALRIEVFRDWPYLYAGDMAYEARYLRPYGVTDGAIVIGAYDDARLVGASTGMPLDAHADDFASAFSATSLVSSDVFYCAESVLLPAYRGQGAGHRFFDLREGFARSLGFQFSAFCAVERDADHPAKAATYRPLDPFWRARGYTPLSGVIAKFAWKDIGNSTETLKPLQFWARRL